MLCLWEHGIAYYRRGPFAVFSIEYSVKFSGIEPSAITRLAKVLAF